MPSESLAPGVPIQERPSTPDPIQAAPTAVTAFVGRARSGPVNDPVRVRSWGEFERSFGGLQPGMTLGPAVRLYFDNGGTDALIVRVARTYADDGSPIDDADITDEALVPTDPLAVARRQGIHALDAVPRFNLLCLPPPTPTADLSPASWALAARFCAAHRALLLVDAPAAWAADPRHLATAALDGVDALVGAMGPALASHAALFSPRLRVADPSDPRSVATVVPCGAVAGVIARTDARRGVWKAPAGTEATVSGTLGPSHALTDAEQDLLNPLGVNGLRRLPGQGLVVWGARTLASRQAPEWRYVPVRRTALFLERSLDQGLDWVVFEPNGEPLWAQIRQVVGNFMSQLFRQGAFQGPSERDAWFVKCDHSTMTQADIDAGRVTVEVGFAPLKPAEFIVIRVRQRTQT